MNLYGFGGGDPVNRSDPFGLSPDTIDVQRHDVAGDIEHASIRVTPDDQERYANDARFKVGPDGKRFVTLGAGPEGCASRGVCLVSNLNRSRDAAPHSGSLRLNLQGRDENEVISTLFSLDAKYGDNLLYGPHTSNSYVSGMLKAAKLHVPPMNGMGWFPGWSNPISIP